jgi:hypothetical protein
VEAEFFAVVEDSEVGVFDDDGDGFAGVGAADADALAGDHDDAGVGHASFDADGSVGSGCDGRGGDAGAA